MFYKINKFLLTTFLFLSCFLYSGHKINIPEDLIKNIELQKKESSISYISYISDEMLKGKLVCIKYLTGFKKDKIFCYFKNEKGTSFVNSKYFNLLQDKYLKGNCN